jgi:hypothetical protein
LKNEDIDSLYEKLILREEAKTEEFMITSSVQNHVLVYESEDELLLRELNLI